MVVMSSLASGSAAIEAERIVGGHQADVGAAELAVGPGIVDVPGELLADDADDDRLALGREMRDARRPRRDGVEDQQHDFDDDDGDFE